MGAPSVNVNLSADGSDHPGLERLGSSMQGMQGLIEGDILGFEDDSLGRNDEEKSFNGVSVDITATLPVEYRSVSRFMALKSVFLEVLDCRGLLLEDPSNLRRTRAQVREYEYMYEYL